ncbi:MAG TPA: MFS transporter [Bryobacteraceae bacterium]|jgi:ACS family hexuronate transporter-like MFS transporter|nr:MFS transporter [Bryobacteraceae bacterium]
MNRSISLRWIAASVFIASSTLNYLDRALLGVLVPLIMVDLHFDQTGYGWLLSAFSIVYAVSSLFAGWFLDRVGVSRGMTVAVAWWSVAASARGLIRSFTGLAITSAGLAVGESAGVPAVGKTNGFYLNPEERALGAAVNQIGISLGLALAPVWIGLATAHSWRTPFVITGLLGFLWIPLWTMIHRAIPPQFPDRPAPAARGTGLKAFSLLRDSRLVTLVIANALWMPSYSLWSNWTTLYMIHVDRISLNQAAHYVWVPPLIANLGGFFGGWLSLRWMRRNCDAITARRRAVTLSAAGMLMTLLLPMTKSPAWSTLIISISFFFALAGSVNIYALPIDLYGPERSGLSIAALGFAYGLMQMLLSPIVGMLSDHRLYTQIVWIVSIPPLLSAVLLNRGVRSSTSEGRQ